MTLDDLKERGWREYPPNGHLTGASRAFALRHENACQCQTNGQTQVHLSFFETIVDGKTYPSYEIDITAETRRGDWVKLSSFSHTELESALDAVDSLVYAWNALATAE